MNMINLHPDYIKKVIKAVAEREDIFLLTDLQNNGSLIIGEYSTKILPRGYSVKKLFVEDTAECLGMSTEDFESAVDVANELDETDDHAWLFSTEESGYLIKAHTFKQGSRKFEQVSEISSQNTKAFPLSIHDRILDIHGKMYAPTDSDTPAIFEKGFSIHTL